MPNRKPSPKPKATSDSAAREEYADAPTMVAELVACDAYHPARLVRRGLWRNMGHWLARAALVGGGSMLVIGLTGPFGVVLAAGLVVPYATVTSVGTHLDQFRGDRALRIRDQVDRWWGPAAQLWPIAFVYLLLGVAFTILANLPGTDAGPQVVAFLGIAFVALAWTESVAFRVLRGGALPDAVGVGIQLAGRRISSYPWNLVRSLTLRRVPPGERFLLHVWMTNVIWTFLSGVIAWVMVVGACEWLGFTRGPGEGVLLLAFLAAGTAAWHSFEAGVGVWVHHYLAYLAEKRGQILAARQALAEE